MSETTSAVIVPKGNELEVSAATPAEMLDCQHSLLDWIKQKIELVKQEAAELKAAFDHAVKSKWKSDTLKRHAALAEKRVSFYEKIQAALSAGYYIVPPFPVTVFAIRTDKEKPLKMWTDSKWENLQQPAQTLPAGEAEYRNPFPVIYEEELRPADPQTGKSAQMQYYAEAWKDVEFPVSMSKPHIMEAATRAMALKVFDDLGILPGTPKSDPMIIARIKDPRSTKWHQVFVSFVVAWHLDTRTL
jgi:hypothetical protein